MAEENNAVMAEVMNLLEDEPAAALPAPTIFINSHLRQGPDIPTFLHFASSLRFWFQTANAKNQSASISHTNK